MDTPPQIPQSFLNTISTCSIETKKAMLDVLLESIEHDQLESAVASTPLPTPTPETVDEYVSLIPDIGLDEDFLQGLQKEVESMNLQGNSRKVKTQWISTSTDSYWFGNVEHPAKPVSEYPYISELMDTINKHDGTTNNMDSCLVTRYAMAKHTLRLHADDENNIDQDASICNFSLGATRTIEFCPKYVESGAAPTLRSYQLTRGSLNIMKPGCQRILKHRVVKGVHAFGGNNVRFSVSFRKLATPSIHPVSDSGTSEQCTEEPSSPPSPNITTSKQPKRKIVLIGGDSFTERLDSSKLGKNRKKVINISKGGSKISEVQQSLESFYTENKDIYSVDKVFRSIGANDIRHCSTNVKHLIGPVTSLIKRTKQMFPLAKVFVQSILPLPIVKPHSAKIVNQMNWLLFNACSKGHIFFLNVFYDFITNNGFRNMNYFSDPKRVGGIPDCHLNSRGMGILARHYLYIIHTKRFNPLGF